MNNQQKLQEELERAMKAGSKAEARRIAEAAFDKYIDCNNAEDDPMILQFAMFYSCICQKAKLERASALTKKYKEDQKMSKGYNERKNGGNCP